MKKMLSVLAALGCSSTTLFAQVAQPQQAQPAQQAQPGSDQPVVVPEEDINGSIAAANAWLALVDNGQYDQSWENGAWTFKFTITKAEWAKAMQKLRQPLGQIKSRTLLEQRVAENPKGLPAGEYMVLYYKSAFSNRPDANELLTLQKESNGQWKVLTYQAR